MKKTLLKSTMFFLSFFLLLSGNVFGQEKTGMTVQSVRQQFSDLKQVSLPTSQISKSIKFNHSSLKVNDKVVISDRSDRSTMSFKGFSKKSANATNETLGAAFQYNELWGNSSNPAVYEFTLNGAQTIYNRLSPVSDDFILYSGTYADGKYYAINIAGTEENPEFYYTVYNAKTWAVESAKRAIDPADMAFSICYDPTNRVAYGLTTDGQKDYLAKFDLSAGKATTIGSGLSVGLVFVTVDPSDGTIMAMGSDGDLYFVNGTNGALQALFQANVIGKYVEDISGGNYINVKPLVSYDQGAVYTSENNLYWFGFVQATDKTDGTTKAIQISMYFTFDWNTGNVNYGLANINEYVVLNGLYEVPPSAAPVADFEIYPSNVEYGSVVRFTDKSTNKPSKRVWEMFLPGTSNPFESQNEVVYGFYEEEGTYDIKLTVSNAAGSDSKTVTGGVTVDAKAYHNYPYNLMGKYFNDPFDRLAFDGWASALDEVEGEDVVILYNNIPKTDSEKYMLFSKWFYFEPGYKYQLITTDFVQGDFTFSVWLAYKDAQGKLTLVSSPVGSYNLVNMTTTEIRYDTPDVVEFQVSDAKNYMLVFVPKVNQSVFTDNSDPSNPIPFARTGMLDFYLGAEPVSSIDGQAADLTKVTVNNGLVKVDGAEGEQVSLFTIDGRQVFSTVAEGTVEIPAQQGVVFVKVGDKVHKVLVK
ncbi:MAG: DUF6383 domain-containing protein [Dysgonomonas sp.]